MAETIVQHLECLAKELSCSICLSVMENPVARLPCCHYFCQDCISQSIRHAAKCPVCKIKATRRDIAEDPTMDRVVRAFRELDQRRGDLAAVAGAAAAPAGGAPAAAAGVAQDDHDAIPWLQGVEDEDFRSLSRSLSGTALENLKRGRSKSPITVQKPNPAGGDNEVSTENKLPNNKTTNTGIDNKKKTSKKGGSGSRKRSDASGSQGIQKFLKKDAAGKKTAGPYTTPADAEAGEERVAESPTMSESLLLGNAGAEAARQLDDIVAGLDSADPTPSEQHGAHAHAAPAGLFNVGATSGKENQEYGGAKKNQQRARMQKKTTTTGGGGTAVASGSKKASANLSTEVTPEEAPDSAGRRRIPTRLVPWNCTVCTFENKGGEGKCQMCQAAKGADTPPAAQQNFPVVAEASPAAIATAAGLATTTGGKTTVNRSSKKRTAAAVGGNTAVVEKQQQQKKMTALKQQKKEKTNTLATVATAVTKADVEKNTSNTKEAGGSSSLSSGWTGGSSSFKWVLLGSGLDSLGKEQLRSLGALSGATIADKWNPRVTHIICGAGGANAAGPGEKTARRTFKYLMGVLHGRWVVTQDWVNATLSSKKKVDETTYQVEKDGVGCVCGATVSRAAAVAGCSTNSGAHLLLRGFEVQLQGEFANKAQMVELVKAAGGKVVSRLPTTGAKSGGGATNTSKKSNKRATEAVGAVGGVVLVEVPDSSEAVAAGFKAAIVAQPWFNKAIETGVPVASHRWLTDSISTFQLCPLDTFLIGS